MAFSARAAIFPFIANEVRQFSELEVAEALALSFSVRSTALLEFCTLTFKFDRCHRTRTALRNAGSLGAVTSRDLYPPPFSRHLNWLKVATTPFSSSLLAMKAGGKAVRTSEPSEVLRASSQLVLQEVTARGRCIQMSGLPTGSWRLLVTTWAEV